MAQRNGPGAGITRRRFIASSAATAVGASTLMYSGNFAYAAGSDRMRVGVVGCGGRGTGAAIDAVDADPGVEIYAMGDLFEDRLERSRAYLKEYVGDRVDVPGERMFTGFDNYKHVADSEVDYVILATPPGFRPMQLRYVAEAGKHVFMEKPSHVDVAGYWSVLETADVADRQGISVVAGTVYRREPVFIQAMERVHEGVIGRITGAYAYYMIGPLWLRERLPGMSDMEWQCRNWYYFTWLSGDHIVEQFVHNIDLMAWVMQAVPEHALSMGGRVARVDPSYGHIYDHFSVEYAFPGDVLLEAKCRQLKGGEELVRNRIVGTEGVMDVRQSVSDPAVVIRSHDGEELLRYGGRPEKPEEGGDVREVPGRGNPFVIEHVDLIEAIREGRPVNEIRQLAQSTMMAVLGRESAYTGRALTWDDLLAADMNLMPQPLAFGDIPAVPVPVPGSTPLNRSFKVGTENG